MPRGSQLFQEGLSNIPAVTLAVLGLNVYLYKFPAAPLREACASFDHVYWYDQWRRLLLFPLHHVDDLHLCFNMASFLWKGFCLERRLGGAWFLYLLSVLFLLNGPVYILLRLELRKLMKIPDPLMRFRQHMVADISECAAGFSGVLFALKVVNNYYNPGDVTYVLNNRVANRVASWAELMLIHLIAPWTSWVAHLAGILVGLLYTVGPLGIIMEICAELVSSLGNRLWRNLYFIFSGRRWRSRPARPPPDVRVKVEVRPEDGVTPEELRERRLRRLERDIAKRRKRGRLN
ncbi:rhomboid-related protein 4-like [Symphorus nematophorus]